jgi:hypothetical protein
MCRSTVAAVTARATYSPRVRRHEWGSLEVEVVGTVRDAKLWPGGGRAWDWNETGTRHSPGIQPADILELLQHGSDVVVLSRGRQLRLEVSREALALLEERRTPVVCYETSAAIDEYNRLAGDGRRAGALVHTTC